jgi:hypothetical protein
MSTTQGAKNQAMNQHLRSEPIPFIDVASHVAGSATRSMPPSSAFSTIASS